MTSRLPRSAGRSLVHLAVSSGTAPVEDWKHSMDSFFLNFFLAKMAWNAMVCETTDVSGGNSIFPILQNTWFQAILAQKKKVSFTEYKDFMECADLAERDDLTGLGFRNFTKWDPEIQCLSNGVWWKTNGVGSMGKVEGGRRGPRMRFYFRIPEN